MATELYKEVVADIIKNDSKPTRGRPRKASGDKKTNIVHVYFSDTELQQLKEKKGFNSLSGYLRHQGLTDKISYNTEKAIVKIKRSEILMEGVKSGLGAVVSEMKKNFQTGITMLEKIKITEPTPKEIHAWAWKGAQAEYHTNKRKRKNKIKLEKLTPPKKGVSP